MYHHDGGSSPPSDTVGYRQNCRCHTRQNCGGGLTLSMVPGSDTGAGGVLAGSWWGDWRCCAVVSLLGHAWAGRLAGGDRGGVAGGRVLAVGTVAGQAGPAAPCPAGDGGLVAGGQCPPGADLADAGGGEQQCGEQGLGGDAADAAAAGLGDGRGGGGGGRIGGGGWPAAGQDRRWYPSASGPSLRWSWQGRRAATCWS